jgi:hypothetical protein
MRPMRYLSPICWCCLNCRISGEAAVPIKLAIDVDRVGQPTWQSFILSTRAKF